ncbi:MAG: hypothetical protein AB9919_12285 [Geobacteraceae bacterium]
MENDKPSKNSECPLCRKVPEDLGLKDHEYFVWNQVLDRYICHFCDLELVIEFYQIESRYFEMASRMVNLDVWEIKRRYLEDVLEGGLIKLSEESDLSEREFLADRIARCKLQIHAIDRYLEVMSRGNDEEIQEELLRLRDAMSIPAFDIDIALANLISVEIP